MEKGVQVGNWLNGLPLAMKREKELKYNERSESLRENRERTSLCLGEFAEIIYHAIDRVHLSAAKPLQENASMVNNVNEQEAWWSWTRRTVARRRPTLGTFSEHSDDYEGTFHRSCFRPSRSASGPPQHCSLSSSTEKLIQIR